MTVTAISPAAFRNGLSASSILALQAKPLYGINGVALHRGVLDVAGLALAPIGYPHGVQLEHEPGIACEFEYGLPNPGAQDAYWYWPNSENSSFKIKINFAETHHTGKEYRFRLRFQGEPDDELERIRTSFSVPKDLGIMENFPSPTGLSRVHTFDTISGVALKGYSDAIRILKLAERYGFRAKTGSVLDWGCGHGRVVRHFRALGARGELFGLDIDPDNIGWAQSHLKGVTFGVGPLMPPTELPGAAFNLVFGISVMTHLTRSVQQAWLEEIRRILRPGGIALLTFTGSSSVAYSSRYLTRTWIEEFEANGTGPDMPDPSLQNVIDDPNYYRIVKVRMDKAVELCSGYLTVIGAHECMFGYQDLLVLQK